MSTLTGTENSVFSPYEWLSRHSCSFLIDFVLEFTTNEIGVRVDGLTP